jgi:signal peptidase I
VAERPPASSEPADTPPPRQAPVEASTAGPAPADPSPAGTAVATREREGKPAKSKKPKGPLSFLKELPALIVIAFVLALLIKTFLVQAFFIPSPSMHPTLQEGDRVLVNKLAYRFGEPERGDIIVFENPDPSSQPDRGALSAFWHWLIEGLGVSSPPDKDFIKRVIGLPGDTVEQRGGRILVNGEVLDEPWLPRGPKDSRPSPPKEVPKGFLYVAGDNRLNSNDSRFGLGLVPRDKVVGKAFVIIWPPSRLGWLQGG